MLIFQEFSIVRVTLGLLQRLAARSAVFFANSSNLAECVVPQGTKAPNNLSSSANSNFARQRAPENLLDPRRPSAAMPLQDRTRFPPTICTSRVTTARQNGRYMRCFCRVFQSKVGQVVDNATQSAAGPAAGVRCISTTVLLPRCASRSIVFFRCRLSSSSDVRGRCRGPSASLLFAQPPPLPLNRRSGPGTGWDSLRPTVRMPEPGTQFWRRQRSPLCTCQAC